MIKVRNFLVGEIEASLASIPFGREIYSRQSLIKTTHSVAVERSPGELNIRHSVEPSATSSTKIFGHLVTPKSVNIDIELKNKKVEELFYSKARKIRGAGFSLENIDPFFRDKPDKLSVLRLGRTMIDLKRAARVVRKSRKG